MLENKINHIFKPGSNFEDAFNLYCFDRELRNLVLKEIEKIEVSVRAKMIYILSHTNGPYWFTDRAVFQDHNTYERFLTTINHDFLKSDEQYIKAFKNKYSDSLPPSWMMLEIISFGTLSMLFKNLKPSPQKRAIAHHFGLDDKTFESWLHCLVYLRNICAHHSRLWNRIMSIQPRFPNSPKKQWLNQKVAIGNNNRTFYALSMILFFLQTVNPHHNFLAKFDMLLKKYPNVDLRSMGFINGYTDESLWK